MFYHKPRTLKQLVNYLQPIDDAYEKFPIEVISIFVIRQNHHSIRYTLISINYFRAKRALKSFLTFEVDKHFSSTVLRVVHLHVTTTFEAHDLCALYLHIPQLYPVDVTPVNKV